MKLQAAFDKVKFQIPVGYILTLPCILNVLYIYLFQIPVGYILTHRRIKAHTTNLFQIPVGYILTVPAPLTSALSAHFKSLWDIF